ncbi:MAG: ABC transporter ATP-binding protein, partial [Mycoplasma sp.]
MNKVKRMSNSKIMFKLILLLNNFICVLLLAIFNGSIGFLTSMSIVIFGSFAIAKFIGENIIMSYELIISLIVILGILRGILRYFEQYLNHFIAFKLLAKFRSKIFICLRNLGVSKLDCKNKGDIISMITADIETLEIFYAHTISPIVIAIIVNLSIFLFLGFYINWYIALIPLMSHILIGFIIPIISSKMLNKTTAEYRNEFSDYNSYILESIRGLKEVIFNNNVEDRILNIEKKTEALLVSNKKHKNKSSTASATTDLCISISVILSTIIAISMVYTKELSIGMMIISISTIFVSFGPTIALSSLPSNLSQTLVSGQRILQLLNEEPMVKKLVDGKDVRFEELSLKNISFSYNENNLILNNVDLSIKKGQIIGLIGESGIGKSTILKLILRFYQLDSGTININGVNIEEINSKNLLDNISLLSQNTYLFNMTVKENLLLANPNATDNEIIEACKASSIHDFIIELPESYDTLICNSGSNLSAGQKQRLGLARIFLKNTDLILLDEPT